MIFPYHHKPAAVIRSRARERMNELTLGVELEVDNGPVTAREATATRINELTDRVYCKHDGSLTTGFEIVSHPGTLAHHMYEMPWRGICAKAKKAGFTSHDAGTCGLHIHVGRAQMGADDDEREMVARKIIVIVNRYWTELTRYTRRRSTQLNRWAAINPIPGYALDTEITDEWARSHIRVHNTHSDRYHAINCENEATIEFRIFRGTLKRDTLIAALQLVWNIVNYAMSHTWDEIQHSAWIDVAQYKHWNENDAYLALRGLAAPCPPAYNTQRTPNFGGRDGINGAR